MRTFIVITFDCLMIQQGIFCENNIFITVAKCAFFFGQIYEIYFKFYKCSARAILIITWINEMSCITSDYWKRYKILHSKTETNSLYLQYKIKIVLIRSSVEMNIYTGNHYI